MAIVETITTSNGVVCRIHDDLYAGVSQAEIDRRRANFYAVANRIMRNAALRKIEAEAQQSRGE